MSYNTLYYGEQNIRELLHNDSCQKQKKEQ